MENGSGSPIASRLGEDLFGKDDESACGGQGSTRVGNRHRSWVVLGLRLQRKELAELPRRDLPVSSDGIQVAWCISVIALRH